MRKVTCSLAGSILIYDNGDASFRIKPAERIDFAIDFKAIADNNSLYFICLNESEASRWVESLQHHLIDVAGQRAEYFSKLQNNEKSSNKDIGTVSDKAITDQSCKQHVLKYSSPPAQHFARNT